MQRDHWSPENHVRLGPWIAPAGIFLLDRREAERLPRECQVPVFLPRNLDRNLDEIREISSFAIRTIQNREPEHQIRDHLLGTIDRMPPRGRRDSCWWVPPEQIGPGLERPAIVIPRIARRLRIIELPPGVIAINHAMTVVSTDPARHTVLMDYLRGPEAQAWAIAQAAPLESGFYSFTTRKLRLLPVPPALASKSLAA